MRIIAFGVRTHHNLTAYDLLSWRTTAWHENSKPTMTQEAHQQSSFPLMPVKAGRSHADSVKVCIHVPLIRHKLHVPLVMSTMWSMLNKSICQSSQSLCTV